MRSAAPLAVALLFAGCTGPAEPVPVPDLPVEASWESQVASVRAGRADEIRVSESAVSAEQFRDIATGCDRLATLMIDQAELRDEDLAVLPRLPNLHWLKLPSAVADEGAEALAACRGLEILNLPNAAFTDAGLARLATLDRLTLLRFGSPNVTDAGINEVAKLPRLKFLHLIGVPVTDAALDDIAAIPTLESFYLDGGRTTDAGLQRLLTKRPDLHFHRDQQHLPGDPNADRHE